MQETGDVEIDPWVGKIHPLEQEIASHSSIPAWRIPWTEKPGRLQSMGCKESDMTEATKHARLHAYSDSTTEHKGIAAAVQALGRVQLFATPQTVAHQVPLSMGFPRQEWSGLPFPSPGDFLTQGLNPHLLRWQVNSFPLSHLGNPLRDQRKQCPQDPKINVLALLPPCYVSLG